MAVRFLDVLGCQMSIMTLFIHTLCNYYSSPCYFPAGLTVTACRVFIPDEVGTVCVCVLCVCVYCVLLCFFGMM